MASKPNATLLSEGFLLLKGLSEDNWLGPHSDGAIDRE